MRPVFRAGQRDGIELAYRSKEQAPSGGRILADVDEQGAIRGDGQTRPVLVHPRRGRGYRKAEPEHRRRGRRLEPLVGQETERGGRHAPRHPLPKARAPSARRRDAGPGRRGTERPILQRGRELRRCRESVRRELLQRLQYGGFHVRRHGPPLLDQGARFARHHASHDGLRRWPGERRVAQQHLVQYAARGKHVAPRRDVPFAHRLLGAHVLRRPQREAGLGHPWPGAARRERDAEVGHQRPSIVQQDVLRFDVAMDDVMPVGVVQRIQHLPRDPDRLADGELAFPVEPVPERLAVHEGHRVPQPAVALPGVEQPEDMGVLKVGGRSDLPQEPLGPDDGGELGAKHLERHLAVVAEVVGQVHVGHSPRAEGALDAIALGQRDGECREWIGHVCRKLLNYSSRKAVLFARDGEPSDGGGFARSRGIHSVDESLQALPSPVHVAGSELRLDRDPTAIGGLDDRIDLETRVVTAPFAAQSRASANFAPSGTSSGGSPEAASIRPLKLKNDVSAVISQIAFSLQPASRSRSVSPASIMEGVSVSLLA